MNAPHSQMHTITLGEKVHFSSPFYPISPWKQEVEPNESLLHLDAAQCGASNNSPIKAMWTFDTRSSRATT